jgi:hypothetical protein
MPPRTRTIAELKREIEHKEMQLRTQLVARLNALDEEISGLGGVRRGRPLGRPKGVKKGPGRGRRSDGKTLIDVLREVLKGSAKGMRAKDIASAAVKAGYHTAAKDFYGIVAAALRDKKSFKRVRRGVYTLA